MHEGDLGWQRPGHLHGLRQGVIRGLGEVGRYHDSPPGGFHAWSIAPREAVIDLRVTTQIAGL
jgi:hypothetical protein